VGDGCDGLRKEEFGVMIVTGDQTYVMEGQTSSTTFVALGS
jgi:hypothetical protein